MRPYFAIVTRDPVRDLQSLQGLLNRDAFRTQHIITQVDPYRDGQMTPTYYSDVHWPFEDGEVVRHAQFMVPVDYRIQRAGSWITVAVGIRAAGTFRLLGTAWDSRLHTYTVGTPFTLLAEETKIPPKSGVVVRIMRSNFPATPLLGAVVETSIGYQGVS